MFCEPCPGHEAAVTATPPPARGPSSRSRKPPVMTAAISAAAREHPEHRLQAAADHEADRASARSSRQSGATPWPCRRPVRASASGKAPACRDRRRC